MDDIIKFSDDLTMEWKDIDKPDQMVQIIKRTCLKCRKECIIGQTVDEDDKQIPSVPEGWRLAPKEYSPAYSILHCPDCVELEKVEEIVDG